MIKYSDMVEVESIKTGERKMVPATKIPKKETTEKTASAEEWRVVNEESSGVRTDNADRQEEI